MLKLKHKLEYGIMIGVDYLLRVMNESDYLSDTLYDHCTATMCISEDPRNKEPSVQKALDWISQFTYSLRGSFFVMDADNQSLTKVNAITGMANSATRLDWALRFGKTILERQDEKGIISYDQYDSVPVDFNHMGQSAKFFTRLYELTNDDKWLDAAKRVRNWILEHAFAGDHWDLIGLTYLRQHDWAEGSDEWMEKALKSHDNDLDVLANYGVIGDLWEDKIKTLCYERLNQQIAPSDPWRCGAFVDSGGIRIDWAERYISSFKRILTSVAKRV